MLNSYRKRNKLKAEFIGRGGTWLDAGNIDDYYDATNYVAALENRQGLKIACLEEIALNNKWIGKNEVKESINFMVIVNIQNILKTC